MCRSDNIKVYYAALTHVRKSEASERWSLRGLEALKNIRGSRQQAIASPLNDTNSLGGEQR